MKVKQQHSAGFFTVWKKVFHGMEKSSGDFPWYGKKFSTVWKTAAVVWLAGAAAGFAQFYIEAGAWARGGMELTVKGGSSAANEGVTAASPGVRGDVAAVEVPELDDNGTAQVLRTFDNGYVGPSGWEWASDLGYTQYFAYESAGQYSATENTLSFVQTVYAEETSQRTETRVSSGAAGWNGTADLDGEGALATLGYTFMTQRLFDVSIQFQAGWLDGMDASFRGEEAWSQQVEWITRESRAVESREWTFVYDTLGNPAFPEAPYEMTDPSGVGPMIADRPTEIDLTNSSEEWSETVIGRKQKTATSRVDLDADLDALVLTLGPRLRFHPVERLAILVEGGVTTTLLDADLERTETFAWDSGEVIQSWSDREDKQKWLWGGTISAGLELSVTDRLTVMAAGGYDWVESCELTVGADRIDVDLDGWRANVALGWSFGGK